MTEFKAYDIRGEYPTEINEAFAYLLGRAFITFTKAKEVMVGSDARVSSPILTASLVSGIIDQGGNVVHIGLATTPQVIAMQSAKKHETAIMVTASHLDAQFNGFKMYTQGGKNINANYGMKEIEALMRAAKFTDPKKKGSLIHQDYTRSYALEVQKHASLAGDKKFVVDCSNGSAGPEMNVHKEKFKNLVLLNAQPDGKFPAHGPNPTKPGAAKQIGIVIKAEKAAGGCIFDADADRVVFVDEKGESIHPNYISCLIIEDLLKRNPKRVVAYDVFSSRVVPETIQAAGGKPLRVRVGRNVLVDDMRREKAIFGAESSSHMIYGELGFADATTLSAILVFDIITKSGKPFSELVKRYAKYALAPERVYCVTDAKKAMESLEKAFPDVKPDHLDGSALIFSDGWIVARASNTEPVLRLRAEADNKTRLDALMAKAETAIKAAGGVPETSSH